MFLKEIPVQSDLTVENPVYAERPSKSVKLAVAPLRAGGAGASEGSIFIFFVVCRVFHTLCNQLVELLSSVGKK